jgi:hypothetical protein
MSLALFRSTLRSAVRDALTEDAAWPPRQTGKPQPAAATIHTLAIRRPIGGQPSDALVALERAP